MTALSLQEQAKVDGLVDVVAMPTELEHVARSHWTSNFGQNVSGMGGANYRAWFRSVLDRILDKATLYAVLDKGNASYVYGWICYEYLAADLPVIHYMYVKKGWRSMGLLQRLATAAGVTAQTNLVYTFKTPKCRRLVAMHKGGTKFIPIETYLKEHR